MDFHEMNVSKQWIDQLGEMGITSPFPVQVQATNAIQSSKDVLIESETGSGKTIAYLLPIVNAVSTELRVAQAIVLAPTNELVMQIYRVADTLTRGSDVRVAALPGGTDLKRQLEKLKEKPHLIIGSPGRIVDILERGKLNVQEIRTIVMDEVDELLDGDGRARIEKLLQRIPKSRQVIFASATMGAKARSAADGWMNEPVSAKGETATSAPLPTTITHLWFQTERRDKLDTLRRLLHTVDPTTAIVFVNQKGTVEEVVSYLAFKGWAVAGLQAADEKEDRKRALDQLREGKVKLLVATDLAARGLDIPSVSHVIHYDIPVDVDHYVHRSGRTGRAGQSGVSILMVAEGQGFIVEKFAKALRTPIEERAMFKGQMTSPSKKAPSHRAVRVKKAVGPKESGRNPAGREASTSKGRDPKVTGSKARDSKVRDPKARDPKASDPKGSERKR